MKEKTNQGDKKVSGIGEWDPNDSKGSAYRVDIANLRRFAEWGNGDNLSNLRESLSAADISNSRHLMRLHKDSWLAVVPELTDEELTQLVRFFTLAEMQLPGWESENLSPVIWLCRELKTRGKFPDKNLISWIRANSTNKFIPYGNILDL